MFFYFIKFEKKHKLGFKNGVNFRFSNGILGAIKIVHFLGRFFFETIFKIYEKL